MGHKLWSQPLGMLILGLLAASVTPAFSQELETSHYAKSWAKINQYSPAETFESRGSFGWLLGLGVVQTPREKSSEVPTEGEINTGTPAVAYPERFPRLSLSKGTPWPVDLGISVARLPLIETAWQWGGHVQWALWEAFQLPTLALRLSRAETVGIPELALLRSDTAQIGSSYALFRFFTLSVAVGQQCQSWEWSKEQVELGLSSLDRQQRTEQRTIYSWGLKLQLLSPFYTLGFEQVLWDQKQSASQAKLSILL